MDPQDSGGTRNRDEDNEAIRLYEASKASGESFPEKDSDDAVSAEPDSSPDDAFLSIPCLFGRKKHKKKREGSLYDSANESKDLGAETTQKRFERLEGDRREALNERVKDENKLRNELGNALLLMVGVQLGVSDLFLGFFMWHNVHSDTVMLAWLSSCVVEIIGIVLVITRSIFPKKNQYVDEETEYMTQAGKMFQIPGAKTSQEEDVSQDTAAKQM